MNAWWFIVFGFLGLMVMGLVVAIVFYIIWKKRYNSLDPHNQRLHKNYQVDEKLNAYDTVARVGGTVAGVAAACALFFTLIAWLGPITSKRDVEYFKNKSEYVELAVKNGDILENLNITHTIIDQNNWLAKAKASLAAYGRFSLYYGTGVEELEPIVIERD